MSPQRAPQRGSSTLHSRAHSPGRRTLPSGTAKWFNSQKGFGFIQPDNGGKDAFVHISAVERSGLSYLSEGQKIQFELKTDSRSGKLSAENLKQVD